MCAWNSVSLHAGVLTLLQNGDSDGSFDVKCGPSWERSFFLEEDLLIGKSLRFQFVACVCSLILVLMLGTLTFIYFRERRILENQLEDLGRATVLNLASSFRDSALQMEYRSMQQILPRLKEQGLIDYGHVFNDEQILASSEPGQFLARQDDRYSREALKVSRENVVFGPIEAFRNNGRYLEFSTAIVEAGPAKAIVKVGYDTHVRIDYVVSETQKSLLWIFLVAVLVGALLSIVLAHAVVAPIRRLASSAGNLIISEYDKPIEVSSTAEEIIVLTDSMNSMREKIKAHIDELDSANMALDRKVFELRTLFDVAETMNFKSYSAELLSYILDTSLRALNAEWGSLWLYNSESDELEVKMVRGAGCDKDETPKQRPGQGIAGVVFETGESVISNLGSKDPRFVSFEGQENFEDTLRHIICVPLLVDNATIGVINLVNKEAEYGDGFNDNDLHLLAALASQAARALEHAKLYDLAIRESKTGLYIPRYFEARLREQITQARRYRQNFSVLISDIDHFKKVNDVHGHMIGDEVIVIVSQFLTESLRENIDIASRWGGEEFAVILPRTDKKGAAAFSERYRHRVERYSADIKKGTPSVTVSVGVATFPEDGSDGETLMQRADDALYSAKRGGRNRVCVPS